MQDPLTASAVPLPAGSMQRGVKEPKIIGIGALTVLSFTAGICRAQSASPPIETVAASPAPADTARFSITLEPTAWWFRDSPAPVPLVTDGLVGNPGTNVLLGGRRLDTRAHLGLRLTAAAALNVRWGVEVSAFYAPRRSTERSVRSTGAPGSTDLFVPFFDVTSNAESISEISFSPVFAGSAREELTTSLLGGELNGVRSLPARGFVKVDLLGGVRFLRLRETFTFTTSSPNIPPEPADVFETRDEFKTTNRFAGLQLGGRARRDWGAFFATATAKVTLGAMSQSVAIDGFLVTNDFNALGATQTFSGGYFALPSNIGRHSRRVFAVVPELKVDLGYRVGRFASISLGYTLLYASNVVRPTQQINRNINPTQSLAYGGSPPPVLQGAPEPSFDFNSTSFLAQSVHLGLAVRFQ
jgi:hypothetical protein